MSLDVYLKLVGMESVVGDIKTGGRIFIREGGQNKEITRAEWDKRFPDVEPITADFCSEDGEVYSANITHNLGQMAKEAGIYKYLWRPDEVDITIAAQLITPLAAGLETLKSDPERFKKLNPENGWGDYEGLVEFVSEYLAACKSFPSASVSVWR